MERSHLEIRCTAKTGFSILHAPFGSSHPKWERLGNCWAGGAGNIVVQISAAASEAAVFRHGQRAPQVLHAG